MRVFSIRRMQPGSTERLVRYCVARFVRDARRKRGMSQQAFADMVGMNRTRLSDIEREEANMTLAVLVKIADGLDVPITSLFPGLENEPLRLVDPQSIGYMAVELPGSGKKGKRGD